MNNTLLKLAITLAALLVLGVRLFKPDLKVDAAVITLLVIAFVPWLSPLVKGVELFGFKIEFQDVGKPKEEQSQPQVVEIKSQSPHPALKAPFAGDTYFSRLLKYTPIEPIVGFIVTSAMVPPPPLFARTSWIVFFAFLLLTLVYFRFFLKVGTLQTAVLTLAFCVWVFAIGGPFVMLSWYQRLYGGLALALFTIIVPLFG
jgi:hypothetical protein